MRLTSAQKITGYPIKLEDGTWGARVDGVEDLQVGARVELTSRQGKQWDAEITEILEDYRCIYLCKVRRLSP
jgi:uncharacterized OB-fold protein